MQVPNMEKAGIRRIRRIDIEDILKELAPKIQKKFSS